MRALSPISRTLSLVLVAALAACATNPVSGKREIMLMSEAEEIALGQQADAEIRREMGVYEDEALQRYVDEIGQRLARVSHRPNLPWSFTVVDHPAINAFALPGGYIYLTRGILPYLDDEAELAGVLGHEIAHVTARHAAQQMTRSGLGGIGLTVLGIFVPETRPFGDLASAGLGVAFLKFDRDDEREADRVGMEYAAQGDWDPRGVPEFLATLARIGETSERGVPNWLSTHPEPAARVVEAEPLAAKVAAAGAASRNRDAYRRQIDNIVVGDRREDGIVRGNAFLHPILRFALEFPEGWDIANTPSQVAAQEPGQPYFMLLQLVDQPRGRTIEEIAVQAMRGARFRLVDGQPASLHGLDAFVGEYQGSIDDVGAVTMQAAHIAHGRQVYLFGGFAPRDQFARVAPLIEKAIGSFRPLTQREADEIEPNRLQFYTARAGDTWQAIAARHGNLVSARDLAIMNGYAVNEQPRPGESIKIVVAR